MSQPVDATLNQLLCHHKLPGNSKPAIILSIGGSTTNNWYTAEQNPVWHQSSSKYYPYNLLFVSLQMSIMFTLFKVQPKCRQTLETNGSADESWPVVHHTTPLCHLRTWFGKGILTWEHILNEADPILLFNRRHVEITEAQTYCMQKHQDSQ